MTSVRRCSQSEVIDPNQRASWSRTASVIVGSERVGPGDRRRDQGPACWRVGGRDLAHDRDVLRRSARVAVEDEHRASDRSTRCREPATGDRRDPGSGTRWPRRRCAAGPSVATTTARAPTAFAVVEGDAGRRRPARTRAPSRTVSSGSPAASCAGTAPMPRRGTPVSPTASILTMMSNRRLDTSRSGSSWMPANSGRQKDSIIWLEKPARCSRASVDMSGRRSRSRTECVRTSSTRSRQSGFVGESADRSRQSVRSRRGCRSGSAIRWKRPAARTTAPAWNRSSSSAPTSRRRPTSG